MATEEDLLLLKAELKEDSRLLKAEIKDELWKLRMLVIAMLVATVALNPKVLELVGRVLGVGR